MIDADSLGHAILSVGTRAYREIVAAFGVGILAKDDSIDRRQLGRIVFADDARRQKLNAIVHPRIRAREEQEILRWNRQTGAGIAVTEAALLIETRAYRRYHRLVLVVASDAVRRQRLRQRGLTATENMERMGAQLPQDRKVRFADYVVDNGGSWSATELQVALLIERLRADLERLCLGFTLQEAVPLATP